MFFFLNIHLSNRLMGFSWEQKAYSMWVLNSKRLNRQLNAQTISIASLISCRSLPISLFSSWILPFNRIQWKSSKVFINGIIGWASCAFRTYNVAQHNHNNNSSEVWSILWKGIIWFHYYLYVLYQSWYSY